MHPAQPGRGGGAAAHTRAMAGVFDIDLDQPEDAGSDEELEEGVRGGRSLSRRSAGREREAAAGSGARGRPEGRERLAARGPALREILLAGGPVGTPWRRAGAAPQLWLR